MLTVSQVAKLPNELKYAADSAEVSEQFLKGRIVIFAEPCFDFIIKVGKDCLEKEANELEEAAEWFEAVLTNCRADRAV